MGRSDEAFRTALEYRGSRWIWIWAFIVEWRSLAYHCSLVSGLARQLGKSNGRRWERGSNGLDRDSEGRANQLVLTRPCYDRWLHAQPACSHTPPSHHKHTSTTPDSLPQPFSHPKNTRNNKSAIPRPALFACLASPSHRPSPLHTINSSQLARPLQPAVYLALPHLSSTHRDRNTSFLDQIK
jgi:hypothetical protein